MAEDSQTFKTCFLLLRALCVSCWKVEKVADKWVAKWSKISLLANGSMIAFLLYIFGRIVNVRNQPTIYKYSSLAFPIFTEFMIMVEVTFMICSNYYIGKLVDVMNFFPPVIRRLESAFPCEQYQWNLKMKRILRTRIILGCAIGISLLYVEYHLVLSYPRIIRFIYHFVFYSVLTLTTNFVISMDYVRENYSYVNFLFERIVEDARERQRVQGTGGEFGKIVLGQKMMTWMTCFMELRQVEEMVNEVFGRQIFFTIVMTFASVIINMYYLIALNMYKTCTIWLNLCFFFGVVETIALVFTTISAAEKASSEANKINEEVYYFPLDIDDWHYYRQVRYFILFLYRYPTQFRAWLFYTLDYSLFFKVMAASSAISIVVLQCEFMRHETNN